MHGKQVPRIVRTPPCPPSLLHQTPSSLSLLITKKALTRHARGVWLLPIISLSRCRPSPFSDVAVPTNTHNLSYEQWLVGMGVLGACCDCGGGDGAVST
jgi:hypothetical protein